MSVLTQLRNRIGCIVGAYPGQAGVANSLTGQQPGFWRGNDVRFEVALLEADGETVITNISALASLTVEILSGQAAAPTILATGTVAAADMNQALSQAAWDDGSSQHAVVAFSNLESALDLGGAASRTFWLAISYLTNGSPARRITIYGGPLTVFEDGTPSGGPVIAGGTLVPVGAVFQAGDLYVLEGLTPGRAYSYYRGANDIKLLNPGTGGQEVVDGAFVAADTYVTLLGTQLQPVTAVVRAEAYFTAEQSDARYQQLGGTEFVWLRLQDVATGQYRTVRVNNGVLVVEQIT
ncbi:MAG: hypothetical protein WCO56_11475 [Verrucomicrobiota bacterium]